MPEGKRAGPEGTKCPMAALLPGAIFKYVLTVAEYVFALSKGRCQKIVKEPGKVRETDDFFFILFMKEPGKVFKLFLFFSFMPCREITCVKEQKHALRL